MTEYSETTACPECESPDVYKRVEKTPAWRCAQCTAEFDLPILRARRSGREGDRILQRNIESVREARANETT